jgi:hypothetical protein
VWGCYALAAEYTAPGTTLSALKYAPVKKRPVLLITAGIRWRYSRKRSDLFLSPSSQWILGSFQHMVIRGTVPMVCMCLKELLGFDNHNFVNETSLKLFY